MRVGGRTGEGWTLECVNHLAEGRVDFLERTVTLDSVALAFGFVPGNERRRLRVVHVEALADGFLVVVSASRGLAAVDEALHQHLVGHIQLEHGSDLRAAFGEHRLEGFGLGNSAGETVENDAFAGAMRVVNACQDANHQFVGDELAVVYKPLGGLAQFGTFLDFCTEHVAS